MLGVIAGGWTSYASTTDTAPTVFGTHLVDLRATLDMNRQVPIGTIVKYG